MQWSPGLRVLPGRYMRSSCRNNVHWADMKDRTQNEHSKKPTPSVKICFSVPQHFLLFISFCCTSFNKRRWVSMESDSCNWKSIFQYLSKYSTLLYLSTWHRNCSGAIRLGKKPVRLKNSSGGFQTEPIIHIKFFSNMNFFKEATSLRYSKHTHQIGWAEASCEPNSNSSLTSSQHVTEHTGSDHQV